MFEAISESTQSAVDTVIRIAGDVFRGIAGAFKGR